MKEFIENVHYYLDNKKVIKSKIMNTKKWFKYSYMTTLLGWLPFSWLSVWGSFTSPTGAIVAVIGLCMCMFGSLALLSLFGDNERFFKSIDELEKEKQFYKEERQRLEKKIQEFIKKTE
jgi:hypothetical protein